MARLSLGRVVWVLPILLVFLSGLSVAEEQWGCFMHDERHSGMAFSVGPSTPQLKWTYDTGFAISNSPVIDADGNIYIGSADFHSLSPDGSERFRFTDCGAIASTAAVSEELGVFFGSFDHNFYCLTTDGELVGRFNTGAYNDGAPTIGTDGSIYFGSRSESFYAFRSDGTLNWSYDAYDWIVSSPAIANDGTIYVGCDDRRLYSFTPYGAVNWSYIGYDWISGSPAIGPNEKIIIPEWGDDRVTCLYPNGELAWTYRTFNDVRSSPAIYADGSVYFGSYDGCLYRISSQGRTNWSYDTGWQIYSSCALDMDGNCYFGAFDGKIYSLNSAGELRWTFETDNFIVSSCALDRDGTLYVGSMDGNLYAIGGGSSDHEPKVGLTLNASSFSLAETMVAFYYIINPWETQLDADVYLAVWDGHELLYYPGLTTIPEPFAPGISIAPQNTFRSEVFHHTFNYDITDGDYRFYLGITRPGTLDVIGPIDSADWEYGSMDTTGNVK
ncbi:PQQ-like beta-propeller repeat protein [bacterium]|nr:PQQ-like beta-propeller repeat protein [bacterium]